MTNNEMLRGIWVFCEQTAGQVRPVAYELLHEAARLAKDMQGSVTAVLLGAGEEQAKELIYRGADQVIHVTDDSLNEMSELRCADEMTALIRKYDPAALLLGATAFGRSMAPRVAARLQTGLTADCTSLDIDPETGLLLQTRPAFGGNLMATITCPNTRPQMATVRPKVFTAAAADKSRTGSIIPEKPATSEDILHVIQKMAVQGEVNIGDADILVSVGQGIGGAENKGQRQQAAGAQDDGEDQVFPVFDVAHQQRAADHAEQAYAAVEHLRHAARSAIAVLQQHAQRAQEADER